MRPSLFPAQLDQLAFRVPPLLLRQLYLLLLFDADVQLVQELILRVERNDPSVE